MACCYETSSNKNATSDENTTIPVRISAITHYPLYNYCIGLQVQFENDAVCSNLKDYLKSEGSFENDFDYLFKVQLDNGDDLYVVFFQLEDFQRVNIESTNGLKDIINNYYIYDKETDLPVNFYEIEGLTNGLYSQAKRDGDYKTFAELNTTWEEAKKQECYKKVDEEQEIYKRVYSLDDYLTNFELVAYYQTADAYTETVFNNNINTIIPPIYLCQRDLSNEILTTIKITKYNKEIKLDFSHGLTKDNITITDENGINYMLEYSCTQNTKITFGNMTNGTF